MTKIKQCAQLTTEETDIQWFCSTYLDIWLVVWDHAFFYPLVEQQAGLILKELIYK